ncbi:MAG: PorV/PorQ family protein [Ignavibacteriales bacterium]|nr:PorV/PorQ family protein [Ignavibacteriales bacterium]
MKRHILFLFAVFVSTSASAGVGTGLPFLKLGIGARSIAMGESFTAIADDASASFYNPAALTLAQKPSLSLMHKQWIGGVTTAYLGAVLPGETFSYALSINSTGLDGIEERMQPGPATGSFGLHDYAATGTIGYRISDDLSIGLSARFLFEKIYIEESSGYSADIGATYRQSRHLSFGAAITNIGSMSPLANESTPLPTALRGGAAYADELTSTISSVLSGDAIKVFGDDGMRLHVGGEVTYDRLFSLRCGYQFGYEAKGLSAGFGICYGILSFDYAFVPFTESLGDTHTFSLSFGLK